MTIHLPVAGVEVWLPWLAVFGLGTGFLIGLFGVGGGFIVTPLLRIVFGIPFPVAVGSSLLQIFLNGLLAIWRHWRAGRVDFRLGILLAAGAMGGTEIGVRLLSLLSRGEAVLIRGRRFDLLDLVLSLLFLVLLFAVAGLILGETSGAPGQGEAGPTRLARRLRGVGLPPMISLPRSGLSSYSLWIPLLIGLAVGVLTGLMGVGGGILNFPILVYVIGTPTHLAVGTSVLQILFASAFGSYRHALLGNTDLLLVAIMSIGSFAGVQLGAWTAGKLKAGRLRRYFALVVLAGALAILADLVIAIWA